MVIILKTYPHHYQPVAQKDKSYIKDTNHFLSELKSLGKLLEGVILSAIDVVGLYFNILHSEGLTSLQKFSELGDKRQISSDTLIELDEIVLKTTFFNSMKKTLSRYVEPQLEQSLDLHMPFCL